MLVLGWLGWLEGLISEGSSVTFPCQCQIFLKVLPGHNTFTRDSFLLRSVCLQVPDPARGDFGRDSGRVTAPARKIPVVLESRRTSYTGSGARMLWRRRYMGVLFQAIKNTHQVGKRLLILLQQEREHILLGDSPNRDGWSSNIASGRGYILHTRLHHLR